MSPVLSASMRPWRPAFLVAGLMLVIWGSSPGMSLQYEMSTFFTSITYHFLGLIGTKVVEHRGGLYGPHFRLALSHYPTAVFGILVGISVGVFWPGGVARKALATGAGLLAASALNIVLPALGFVIGPHFQGVALAVVSFLWPAAHVTAGAFAWRAALKRDPQHLPPADFQKALDSRGVEPCKP